MHPRKTIPRLHHPFNPLLALALWFACLQIAPAMLRPVELDQRAENERQHAELERQLKQGKWYRGLMENGQACHPAALLLDADRDPADVVLRRTEALLGYVGQLPGAPDLAQAAQRLKELQARNETSRVQDRPTRYALYEAACRLRREIAFANPLLDFDRILFLKRHRATFEHMCDQYYGFFARPGGGLCIVHDPFGPNPRISNLVGETMVERGRLKGGTLTGGAFLSPDLSFDGGTVLFAYTQAAAEGPNWSPERSYHIFKIQTDGTGLEQLTDGAWNDFDPCWLPDGRIAFVSERRGGYLRCGARPCPTYTLHRMEADGTGIVCISFHETHEWHPSVDHDGRIVYTRWDYVDRDTNIAQHPWWTTPEGYDPRPVHGNYPERRESRPWMEMDIRAVPGSGKYISTAAPHHGQAYGSLVLIDPSVEDDGAMSPVRRFTPDVPFPESESGKKGIRACEVYGTAWPLSEAVCLCAYDVEAATYGIYLVDHFGNKELIYRDESIGCLSPIPFRPRPAPPVLPAHSEPDSTLATVSVVNVYESDLPWPRDTQITALRIIQVLPKTTPSNDQPRIGIGRQTNARAVLGTVPVEADGSAHFLAPAGMPVYFQALDKKGLAVQSMRSVTYLQPGQRLTCMGCHESSRRAPTDTGNVSLALQRAPSRIQPESNGSNPFNYVRLVQPVLDKHCVGCHREKEALDLSGKVEGQFGWTQSYHSLAEKYGFFFHVYNGSINTGVHGGSRTIPGQFGAQASALIAYLDERHYGVALAQDEWHRLTLWLDCNSEFYGAYENTQAQAQGAVIHPTLR